MLVGVAVHVSTVPIGQDTQMTAVNVTAVKDKIRDMVGTIVLHILDVLVLVGK
jgi:hypothetical protein